MSRVTVSRMQNTSLTVCMESLINHWKIMIGIVLQKCSNTRLSAPQSYIAISGRHIGRCRHTMQTLKFVPLIRFNKSCLLIHRFSMIARERRVERRHLPLTSHFHTQTEEIEPLRDEGAAVRNPSIKTEALGLNHRFQIKTTTAACQRIYQKKEMRSKASLK